MENLKIQQNLEENVKKVFEKLREEGLKGIQTSENSYPIEVHEEIELIGGYGTIAPYDKKNIKKYNNYMKIVQVLEDLFQMFECYNLKNIESNNYIKNKISKEIEYIQNTAIQSLNSNYIKQYSCLIKCYKSLLRDLSYFN